MKSVINRDIMVDLLKIGFFGNSVLTWKTKEELFQSGFKNNVYIRYRGYNAMQKQGLFLQDIPINNVIEQIKEAIYQGFFEKNMYFGEWINLEWIRYNCVLCRSIDYFDLMVSDVKKTLREAMKEKSDYYFGLDAVNFLKREAPDDFQHFLWLANEFPHDTIEFTLYPPLISVGTFQRSYLVWGVGNF